MSNASKWAWEVVTGEDWGHGSDESTGYDYDCAEDAFDDGILIYEKYLALGEPTGLTLIMDRGDDLEPLQFFYRHQTQDFSCSEYGEDNPFAACYE